MNSEVSAEMPRYECHKKVHALKLKRISHSTDINGQQDHYQCVLFPEDDRYAPITVDYSWCSAKIDDVEHNGDPGYYVVYEDGYKSWSPTKAFEKGYTRV